jgi:hypothetical protein
VLEERSVELAWRLRVKMLLDAGEPLTATLVG